MALTEGKYVMLSYNGKSKNVVKVVYNALRAENIPVWFAEKDMEDDLYESQGGAVSNAAVFCCFLTPHYEQSTNCQREIKQAADLVTEYAKNNEPEKLLIIPCMLIDKDNPKWEPAPWLKNIIRGKLEIRMKDNSDSSIELLTKELICKIKSKPSKPTIEQTPSPVNLFETIRQKYLRDNQMKRMVHEEKSFPIEQSYVNLAMVGTKEQQEKEKKLKQHDQNYRSKQHSHEILGSYEEIYGAKTSTDVTKIFEKCKNQTNKVLVLGRAGIGKSTFCQYVTYRWAKQEMWSQYNLVVLIWLRELTDSRYPPGENYSPIDLVKKEYFPFHDLSKEEKDRFQEQCDTDKVLWILDGYDEYVQSIPEQLKGVFDHIRDTQHHILTSRPYTIALSYDVKVEIIGFTDDNITQYVEQFFHQIRDQLAEATIQGQNLLKFLKSNPNIWGVAHIPVNVELICSLWSDNNWSKTKYLTMTALYDNITEWLCRRHLKKQNIDAEQKRKNWVYSRCDKELQFLETLAFNAIESHKIILPSALLENTENETEYSLDEHPQLLNFGILESYNDKSTINQTQAEKQHYFSHLSFQEHFAARHLLKILKSSDKQKATNFINNHKYDQRFQLVFIFAAGLLAQSDYQPCTNAFWTIIQGEPLDLVGLNHIKLIIQCIDELQNQTVFRECARYLQSITQWFDICLTEPAFVITKHLLQSLQRTTSILNTTIIQNKLIELMTATNTITKRKIFYIISELTISEPVPKILSTICDALRDEDSYVSARACKALGQIGEKAATTDVIAALANALRDEDSDVRTSACKALGQIGEKAATTDVIAALINALRDEDSDVRTSACKALGQIGEKAATTDVIAALINALRDEHSYVRSSACSVLGQIGEKAATTDVIAALINALLDEDFRVRSSACYALGQIGEKAATTDVIAVLIIALLDDDFRVRSSACKALGQIGEKAATTDLINGLINALRDEKSCARGFACKALGQIGEKAATTDVITALINALRDEDFRVRTSACKALGQIGEKAATTDVITAMINALRDEYWVVRSNACEALGQIGEKTATTDVIAALINALRDEDSDVRTSACEALGQIGEKAATTDVIAALINALRDEYWVVRSSARKVLGQIGEKSATTDVIAVLINALRDEDFRVRSSACSVLGQIGEKAATTDVIAALINALNDKIYIGRDGGKALEQAMRSYHGIKGLDSDMVRKLYSCVREFSQVKLAAVPGDQWIKVFLETRNDAWLPLVRYAALLQGVAVTTVNNRIIIYDVERVSEFVVETELMDSFLKYFRSQVTELKG